MSTSSPAVPGRSEAYQQFLKLVQPIDESTYPSHRIMKAGQTYNFPLHFVVPNQLLPTSCTHSTQNDKIKDCHLGLPPSIGEPEMCGQGNLLQCDMAPAMSRISYALKVRLLHTREHKEIILSEKIKKIRIIPAIEEAPPVTICDVEGEYCTRIEKSIRRGVFKGKAGRLAMEASQPKSLVLPPPAKVSDAHITTIASLVLRFDPIDENAKPPRLGHLISRLKVATFYASTPRSMFPSKTQLIHDMTQGLYVDVLPLSSRSMQAAEWEYHPAKTATADVSFRRDSAASTNSMIGCPEPTSTYSPKLPFYTTRLRVPITLPKKKAFVPTFHNCLISRIYLLELCLSISGPSGPSSTVTLKVPIQISSETASLPSEVDERGQNVEAFEHVGDPEVDFYHPRSMSVPSIMPETPAYVDTRASVSGAAMLRPAPPPEYSYFAPRSGRQAVAHDTPEWTHNLSNFSMVRS